MCWFDFKKKEKNASFVEIQLRQRHGNKIAGEGKEKI